MLEMTLLNFKESITDPKFDNWDSLLINLIDLYNTHTVNNDIRDIVLRLLERRKDLGNAAKLLDHLIGELGLYPYLQEKKLDFKDRIRHTLFSAPELVDKTFHIKQAEVFHKLMSGKSVALSAPTSFGKSLIIEAIIADYKFDNIVIVVPTIALIDELKKKLHKYNDHYKIVTQSNQKVTDRNLFIYTQERVIESNNLEKVDFFVIDEFYKLAPTSTDDYRCDRLNLAFHKLHNQCKHFYMLGPNIEGISEGIEKTLSCNLVKYDHFKTVSTNEYYYEIKSTGSDNKKDEERDIHLSSILDSIGAKQQTVIFCKSPKRANNLINKIINLGIIPKSEKNSDLSHWLKEVYHQDWNLALGIEHGIACHHAKLPRSLGSLIVEMFNSSKINILVCTSTLIEGVNTNARNIIIYDDCLTRNEKLDTFTFNNISGRSGRMFEHYVGNVYILGDKPQEALPFVDIPIVSQSDNASPSMLLQISEELDDAGKRKISRYTNQTTLPIELLNKHQGIPPERLLEFAEVFVDKCGKWHRLMNWTEAYPKKNQLNHLCVLMMEYFKVTTMGSGCIRSTKQLNSRIRDVMGNVSDKDMILEEYNYRKSEDSKYTIDDAVQVIFEFKRNLIGYNLPKIIFAINDIQKLIFERFSYTPGDYSSFAVHLESFFELPALSYLEEYGIPFHISRKIINDIKLNEQDDLDDVIRKIKEKISTIRRNESISSFEHEILKNAIKFM
ncbi:DEAD/DEAH box helicase [Pseudoalteromonas sp. MMG012]|uniref:DEAD/DEAH box helicase n=1 Tax=Pseudoalteromonas sp. MMG012 TaxID=2822686 RepID=UPI001B39FB2E|nr:DEAD/DEAH box helicase [Pseudoalteromonas sp. MMG012]MBQ4852148.1 DEAD/DEAH box helicase [Pseudoalteromonas sp. MMG012]